MCTCGVWACNEKHARWLPSAIKPLYPVVHVSFVVQDFQQEVCRFREQCADTARIPIADDVSSLFSKTMLSMDRLLAASPREYKNTGSCSSRHPQILHAMPCQESRTRLDKDGVQDDCCASRPNHAVDCLAGYEV